MKAAVLDSGVPKYLEMAEPVPQSSDEVLVSVRAVALKHLDKSRAKGTHYSSAGVGSGAASGGASAGLETGDAPAVIGGDGICVLSDGTRVYALGASGMMAEKATVEKDRMVVLPAGLDDVTAAALPNAVFGAAMALRFRAGIEPGDTVLINGATGFTGKIAVQIARHYGAGYVIGTGRNEQSLKDLASLGVDEVISLHDDLGGKLRDIHARRPINVVIDYLWGQTAEIILSCFKGKGSFTPRTRFVSVGSMAGDLIQLSAANLRSVDLQLSGSGLGSWTKGQVRLLFTEILPEMFRLAADGKLKVDTVPVPISEIGGLWDMEVPDGKRLVVTL